MSFWLLESSAFFSPVGPKFAHHILQDSQCLVGANLFSPKTQTKRQTLTASSEPNLTLIPISIPGSRLDGRISGYSLKACSTMSRCCSCADRTSHPSPAREPACSGPAPQPGALALRVRRGTREGRALDSLCK